MSEFLIEKKVSNLVEYQFPEFYRTDGPVFVQFVKEYYKWLEGKSYKSVKQAKIRVSVNAKNKTVTTTSFSFYDYFVAGDKIAIYEDDLDYRIYDIEEIVSESEATLVQESSFTGSNQEVGKVVYLENVNYHARRLFDYDDIDNTVEGFVVYFKEKYLKNIQFETETNTRQLVKHALDIYRSKGTERGIELLFRLVFGEPTSFYYPKTDIFKLSDGKWNVPKYLELELNENTVHFVNKQIYGLDSGATAFAEALIRRTIKGKLIDVLYLSTINGNFVTNEVINTKDLMIDNSECPRIVGSLSEIDVDVNGVGELYKVGDIVNVSSNTGEQALARVANVSNIVGVVEFNLKDTGYAYTSNATVLVSEKVLVLNNVTSSNTDSYFSLFESVYQPLANISYDTANNTFVAGDNIQTYYANNLVKGQGVVLSVQQTNSTSGTLLLSQTSGNLNSNAIYKTSNAIYANVVTFTDRTAYGNLIAYSSNVNISTSNLTGTFITGEEIYQVDALGLKNANAQLTKYTTSVGSNGVIKTVDLRNAFITSNTIYGATSGATAKIQSVSLNAGLIDIVNDFYSYEGNRIYGNTIGSTANVQTVSTGENATFALANSLLYSETVQLATDFIRDYANVALNAVAYGFPHMPLANAGTIILDALNFDILDVGRPNKIQSLNKGSNYNIPPFVLVFEPLTHFSKRQNKVELVVSPSSFYIGELVTQPSSNARGLVVSTNSTTIVVENLRLFPNNDFVVTTNSTNYILGQSSALEGNVSIINQYSRDSSFTIMGSDLQIDANAKSSAGAITNLTVIDSGLGFNDKQEVSITKEGLTDVQGLAVVKTSGKSKGKYKQKGGFTSDQKKIQDGYYYQNYSYEIRSSVPLIRYEEMLKKLLHVSGTKYFGAFVKESKQSVAISSKSTIITVS